MNQIYPTLYDNKTVSIQNTVTIAAGGNTSSLLKLGGFTITGIVFPANFTDTLVTFAPVIDGVSYALIDPASYATTIQPYTLPAQAGNVYPLDMAVFGCISDQIFITCVDPQLSEVDIIFTMGPLWQ